ncbi:hypothetical protein ABZX12_38150 [Kribbella sp. NPDC003505]|uniref:hypothetical protein n=1 Tax=Kribbella sp. NPDC003505 TaxID=3154448 RepID=UPI00339ED13D
MRLLVLGGTKNLGRHVVEAALADGHEVTLFNRGRTTPHCSRRYAGSWATAPRPRPWRPASGTA